MLFVSTRCCSSLTSEWKGHFRVLDLGRRLAGSERKDNVPVTKKPLSRWPLLNRSQVQSPDQRWESVWPSTKTFHPSVVPLPLRQGFIHLKSQVHPEKKANVELMKIPNFLHLTPPTIQRQCAVIKKFCTKWPKELDVKDVPVLKTSMQYLNSSSSIKDHRAKVVILCVLVDALKLRNHETFLRLVGERVSDGIVTITADSCPFRKQNEDYSEYLLTAVYFESSKCTALEEKKMHTDSFTDGEEGSSSKWKLLNAGEDTESLKNYKKAVVDSL